MQVDELTGFVLVGGLGSRLRDVVRDRPKPMAPIAGRPFLEYVLRYLRRAGIRRVVLCVGHRGDAVREYFADGARWGLDIAYSPEGRVLGTGGAMKRAVHAAGVNGLALVMNGDSFVELDLPAMVAAHRERRALVTMALARMDDTGRFGRVELGPDRAVVRFAEKTEVGPGTINAGVYLAESAFVEAIPSGTDVSLEEDMFPRFIGRGAFGFVTNGFFMDIGVPADYLRLAADPDPLLAAVGLAEEPA